MSTPVVRHLSEELDWASFALCQLHGTGQEWTGTTALSLPAVRPHILETCRKFKWQGSQQSYKRREVTLGCSTTKAPNIHYLVTSFLQIKHKLEIPDTLLLTTCNKKLHPAKRLFCIAPNAVTNCAHCLCSSHFPRQFLAGGTLETCKRYEPTKPTWTAFLLGI